jgi:hypothetical protein
MRLVYFFEVTVIENKHREVRSSSENMHYIPVFCFADTAILIFLNGFAVKEIQV